VKDPSIGNGKALEDKLITLLNMIMETFQTANESAANNISVRCRLFRTILATLFDAIMFYL
jgi:hypothetical protein